MKLLMARLKEDFSCRDEKFNDIILQSFVIGLFIFLSVFWKWFSIVPLIFVSAFTLHYRNGKSLYYLLFLLPLMSIFKFNTNGSYLLTIAVVIVLAILSLQLIVDILKKKKKINWFFSIMFAIVIIYFSLPFSFPSLSIWGSLILGCALLFVSYYYWNDLNLKELILIFGFGMLFSVVIGIFLPLSSRLLKMISQYSALGFYRYSGAAENVNVFAGELMIAFSLFTFLFIKKEINLLYYPVYLLCAVLLTLTLSKSALIIFLVINLWLFASVWFKFKAKKSLIILAVVVGLYSLTFAMFPNKNVAYWCRLLNISYTRHLPEVEPPKVEEPEEDKEDEVTPGKTDQQILSELTTGRTEIWKQYLDKILESPKSILFGYGVGAESVGKFGALENCSSHNTYLQCVYYVGIVGIGIIILWLLSIVNFKKIKKLDVFSFIVPISVALFLFGLDFFSFRLGNYMLLIFSVLMKKDEKTEVLDKEGKEDEKNLENV